MNELQLAELAQRGAGYGVWTLVLIAMVTLIKGWPALKKLSIEADGSLRKDLLERIGTLEGKLEEGSEQLAIERRECDRQLEELRKEIAGLHRQMITFQLVSGQPIALEAMPPATADAARRLADLIREDMQSKREEQR
ncbi:MAG TPA: hypothetical protein VFJ46_17820 [Xanthobacteraceae bacterium]|nr:hypothetical protein [Xanthobacteraceae bacterium]